MTGAAGFIGSHLVEKLLDLGQTVIGLDNLSTGNQRNLDEVRSTVRSDHWAKFRFLKGDICNLDECRKACEGVDYVLHQAALGSVPRSLHDPIRSHQNNVDGFMNMLVAARDAKVQRFVYASSSSVYGDHPALPKVEANIGQPLSPYAATKLINEVYAAVFTRCYGLSTVGLRYFNVFCPRQDPNGAYAAVIPRWIAALLRGEPLIINGDGTTSRDFCYVANVVQSNLLAALASATDLAPFFNIAAGRRTTLLELSAYISRIFLRDLRNETPRIQHANERQGDVQHSLANVSRAQQQLGYTPLYSVKQGLLECRLWYLKSVRGTQDGGIALS